MVRPVLQDKITSGRRRSLPYIRPFSARTRGVQTTIV